MACCSPMNLLKGKPIQYTQTAPDYLQDLQRQQAQYAGQQLGKPATPYGGPMSVGMDPMMLMAANIMMNLGGYGGYNPPNFYGGMPNQMGGMPGQDMMNPGGPRGIPGQMGGMPGQMSPMGGMRPMGSPMGGGFGRGMMSPYGMAGREQYRMQR